VFPHHTRANECCQLAAHAASRVVPGMLQDHRAFPCNGILPDLADFYWVCDPASRSGRGATFAPKSRIGDVWSANLTLGLLPACSSSANNRRQVSMKLSTIRNGARTESRVLSEDCGSHMLSRQVFRKVCRSNVTFGNAHSRSPFDIPA